MEEELLELIRKEISRFASAGNIATVLCFKPCNSFYRFKIHNMVEVEFSPQLKTFSVCEGSQRRLVLSWMARQGELQSNGNSKAQAPSGKGENNGNAHEAVKAATSLVPNAPKTGKRPDRLVYVPRALRKLQQSQVDEAAPKPAATLTSTGAVKALSDEDLDDDEVLLRIGAKLGAVKVLHSKIKLPEASTTEVDSLLIPLGSPESVIVEAYDFNPSLKTSDLTAELAPYKGRFDIKWVDDTHALVVFDTPTCASGALETGRISRRGLKLRPLSEASEQSKNRAAQLEQFWTAAPRPRPETSSLVARRMMGGALGIDLSGGDRGAEEAEKLRRAKDKKEQKKAEASASLGL